MKYIIYLFQEGWSCKGLKSSESFTEINLDEGFCDYDEEAHEPVSITELEAKII